ncbi:MAG: site-specific integrase [Lachnospiraceae bacterium]|nr:site-specific integrase [Lachnospiraceae bacterium]
MTAGHLQIKKGNYYAVLTYVTADGKRKQPWIPLGIPAIRGNKKKAQEALAKLRREYRPPKEIISDFGLCSDMLFADFMEIWLEIIRSTVEKTTFASYTQMVKGKIVPYFRAKGITLEQLRAQHIQNFYMRELKTVSANTVIHEHANIHKALKYAVRMDLIPSNPADKVERPKKEHYVADYYKMDELEKLFEVTKDHPLSLLIQMTAFYGLRRGEVIGIKWNAIDFDRNTVTIRHTVTESKADGKRTLIASDRAKTKSSLRTLPLVVSFKEKLLALREQQKENARICGTSYCQDYKDYVFVDQLGNLFTPNAVSENFAAILQKHGLRKIRFHDLRHSCASLLLANNVPMKQIQEWLGHSDISTTANIYSHLDFSSKIVSANVMDDVLELPKSDGMKQWVVKK